MLHVHATTHSGTIYSNFGQWGSQISSQSALRPETQAVLSSCSDDVMVQIYSPHGYILLPVSYPEANN